MTEIPALPELSSDRLNEFRHTFIRDDWDGTRGLSRFNQAQKARFFSDDDLRFMDTRICADKAEELDAVYQDKADERKALEDTDAEAEATAEATRWEARLRLLRAECLRMMKNDPAFRASLIVGERSGLAEKIVEQWNAQIEEDEQWAQSRSGEYAMIRLERM